MITIASPRRQQATAERKNVIRKMATSRFEQDGSSALTRSWTVLEAMGGLRPRQPHVTPPVSLEYSFMDMDMDKDKDKDKDGQAPMQCTYAIVIQQQNQKGLFVVPDSFDSTRNPAILVRSTGSPAHRFIYPRNLMEAQMERSKEGITDQQAKTRVSRHRSARSLHQSQAESSDGRDTPPGKPNHSHHMYSFGVVWVFREGLGCGGLPVMIDSLGH
ncbi:hypothetical protein TgHK011_008546 [Trichoderma gracile]|nr:hypothetical protein TgHK011_008546 [Trichoderma gracile]